VNNPRFTFVPVTPPRPGQSSLCPSTAAALTSHPGIPHSVDVCPFPHLQAHTRRRHIGIAHRDAKGPRQVH
jgi:hypothetical protein